MSSADRLRRTKHRARRGFTLVELLGVVVILGLISSIAFVSYQSMIPASVLNSAVRELASTLQETRSEAIARSQPFWIEYYFEDTDAHPKGYRVVTPFVASTTGGIAVRPEDRAAQPFMPLPEGVEFREITLNGNTVTRGQVVVRFDPLGAATDHTIVLEHKPYEAVYTIEVQALTGLIAFHDGVFRREPAKEADFGS
ncbi:MAG: GspH/FimT family pseudopilin [Planctomycetes bacterium]|nr:GspH/FimT family pseudopilin [Planctomycetota bacterium]